MDCFLAKINFSKNNICTDGSKGDKISLNQKTNERGFTL